MEIFRRTFEAKKHPKGSKERISLNFNARTSEYMPSYKYLLIGHRFERAFRTKREATEVMNQLKKSKYI